MRLTSITKNINDIITEGYNLPEVNPQLSSKSTSANDAKKTEEIKKLSNEFESLFLGIVIKAMRQAIPESGLMGGSNAEKIYKSMLDDEYAKLLAAQRKTGLADNIQDFLMGQTQTQGLSAYSKSK